MPKDTETIEISPREAAYTVLREAGAGNTAVCEALGIARQSGSRIDKRVAEKGINITLASDRMVRKAHRVTNRLMGGKPAAPGAAEPKASDSLAAAREVLDRAEPKVKQVLVGKVDISPVDLDKYQVGTDIAKGE